MDRNYYKRKDTDTEEEKQKVEIKDTEVPSNIFFEAHPEKSTAVLGIRSFGHHYIEKDSDTINKIYDALGVYDNLIIDIQGNTGGSSYYFINHLIMNLIDKDYYWDINLVFRNNSFVEYYFPSIFNDSTEELPDLPNLPSELHEWDVLVSTDIAS